MDAYFDGVKVNFRKQIGYQSDGTTPLYEPFDEAAILATARFFTITFYDPIGGTFDPTTVANISILNKANELENVVHEITRITEIKDVILVGHSMGGLVARAYLENLASATPCSNYPLGTPDYFNGFCVPGQTPYAGDVAQLITIDTPHGGALFAGLSLPAGGCFIVSSTNKTEMQPSSLLLDTLNYVASSISAPAQFPTEVTVQSFESYFTDGPLDIVGTDTVIGTDHQSMETSLSTSAKNGGQFGDWHNPYTFEEIAPQPNCNLFGLVILHILPCVGSQANTQGLLYSIVKPIVNGTLDGVTVQATFDSGSGPKPWTGPEPIQYHLEAQGVIGTLPMLNGTEVPKEFPAVPVGTYQLVYDSGGPTGTNIQNYVSPIIAVLESDNWNPTFTINFVQVAGGGTLPTTAAATQITSYSAQLNGTVNPNGSSGSAYFLVSSDSSFGTGTYGTVTANVTPNNSVQTISISSFSTLNGHFLPSNTTFYYRTVFVNSTNGETEYGPVVSFTTLPTPVVTSVATQITSNGAQLNGTVNPNGSSGSAYFLVSPDSSFGTGVYGTVTANLTPNNSVQTISISSFSTLNGHPLPSNTTFYYRTVFVNSTNGETQYGPVVSFTTLPTPVTTAVATNITSSGATMNGTVNANGSVGNAHFDYGKDSSFAAGSFTSAGSFGIDASNNTRTLPIGVGVSGLSSGTVYYCRLVFSNSVNGETQYGNTASFATLTSTSASPSISVSPAAIVFSSQLVGTASASQEVTVSNPGDAALVISSILIGGGNNGDFKIAAGTTCPSGGGTLTAGSSCQLNVTFNPTSAGSRSGVLTISDNASGTPHSVALTGSATDLAIGTQSGSTTSATVGAGHSAGFNLQIAPSNGFTGSVTLSCSSPTSTISCSVTPSSVIVGTAAVPFAVTAVTMARSLSFPRIDTYPSSTVGTRIVVILIIQALVLLFGRVRLMRLRTVSLLIVVFLCGIALSSCAGGGASGPSTGTTQTGTLPGTYTLTVTAASRGASRSLPLTLIVQ